MKVVLVSGKLQSGKNTFTDFLIDEVKKNKTIDFEYFAKPVKQECREVFKTLIKYLNDLSLKYNIKELHTEEESWFEKKNEITRILLQTYGTDIFRDKVDSNWWAKKLKNKILKRTEDVIVITDVRFKSEIETLYSLEEHNIELIKIRIERNNFVRDDNPIHTHQSEIDLDDFENWDYLVENDNGLDDLKAQAIHISKDLF